MEHNQNLTMLDIGYWYELEEMLELLHLVIASENIDVVYTAIDTNIDTLSKN